MKRTAIHPGEVLADELEEIGISPTELARQLAVPANRISQIVKGKRAITGDTALRLGHWFGMSSQFWLNLQAPTTCLSRRVLPVPRLESCRPEPRMQRRARADVQGVLRQSG